MKTIIRTLALFGIVLTGSAAFADPISITSINMEVRTSTYQVDGTESVINDLLPEFHNNGTQVCNVSLDAVDKVGSTQNCSGPNNNIATLITLHFTQTQRIDWEFGGDWGRGGGVYRVGEVLVTDDIWWEENWNHPTDIIRFWTNGSGTLGLIGFEGCCGGPMSLRYSTDGRETWTIAAVNAVPEPGTLALLGLGLLGLGFSRRRKTV